MFEYDSLKIYSGDDIKITNKIIVTQPTIKQIKDFGEQYYFNVVYTLTSVGADMKWQLWDMGIDYTQIQDYDLFIKFIAPMIASKKRIYENLMNNKEKNFDKLKSLSEEELAKMLINPLKLIIKDVDLADFIPVKTKYAEENEQIVLYNPKNEIIINRFIYSKIVDVVRKIHGFNRNNEIPANETTKIALIEEARDNAMITKKKTNTSILMPLISTLKVKNGQCGKDTIWNMKINEFLYDIKRVNKILDVESLLQGAYSGFASLKDVEKNRLNMFAEI